MLFENALYYPTIDINDEAWLKSAVLLWDTISTIVPDSEAEPYKNDWSRAFARADVLVPYKVSPTSVNFRGLENEVKAYLDSPEGKRSFKPRVGKRSDYHRTIDIVRECQINDLLWRDYGDFRISVEKFGTGLQDVISDYVTDDGYVITSPAFMNFYMTSLANSICQGDDSKALLTDLTYTNDLTNVMMRHSSNQRMGEDMIAQGLMYKYIIQGFKIGPETPVDKLIKFREDYKDERNEFKYEISNLIQANKMEGLPASEVINQIGRIYKMKVLPTYNKLQRALDGMNIDYTMGAGTSIALAGIVACDPSGVGAFTFGWKALKDIFVSVYCKRVKYNKNKEKMLSDSPYSYLYRINKLRMSGLRR